MGPPQVAGVDATSGGSLFTVDFNKRFLGIEVQKRSRAATRVSCAQAERETFDKPPPRRTGWRFDLMHDLQTVFSSGPIRDIHCCKPLRFYICAYHRFRHSFPPNPAEKKLLLQVQVANCLGARSISRRPNIDNYFVMIPTGPRPSEALTEGFFNLAANQSPKPKTMAILAPDAPFSKAPVEGAKANRHGFRLVAEHRYPLSDAEFVASLALSNH
jgi:hypothetical protein